MSRVITISREFGSGGREVGFRLAERLGIPFYDKEIISMAAENSNIAEEVFHAHDEMIAHKERADAHPYVSANPFSTLYEVPVSDQLFMIQSQIIRKLGRALCDYRPLLGHHCGRRFPCVYLRRAKKAGGTDTKPGAGRRQ